MLVGMTLCTAYAMPSRVPISCLMSFVRPMALSRACCWRRGVFCRHDCGTFSLAAYERRHDSWNDRVVLPPFLYELPVLD